MKRSPRKEYALIILALISLLGFMHHDIVFLGKTFKLTTANPQALYTGPYGQENNRPAYFPVLSTDIVFIDETIPQFIGKSLRQGVLPLWNPHQACGYPLIGMMQTGLFWPLNFILYFLPNLYAWDIMMFLRFFLIGFFTYAFMRTLRFGPIPALGATMIFMFSGQVVLQQRAYTHVELLLPLILLAFERLIRRASLKESCLAGAAVALTFFAGNPEHVFFVNAFACTFFLFRLLTVSPRPRRLQAVIKLFLAYALALGLGAMVLLPFLQNWLYEFWHAHPPDMGLRIEGQTIVKEAIINLFFPRFFQIAPVTLEFTRFSELGYLGIIPFAFIFLGLWKKQKKGLNYYFAAVAFLLFSKNYLDFFLSNWFGMVPIFRIARFYLNTQHLFAFHLSIVAGMGIRYFLLTKRPFLKVLIFAGSVAALLIWALRYYHQAPFFPLAMKAAVFAAIVLATLILLALLKEFRLLKTKAWGLILLAAIALELFFYIPREHVRRFDSYPKVPYIEFIKNLPSRERAYGIFWTFYPNTASPYLIDDLGIEEGLLLERYINFVDHFLAPGYFTKENLRNSFRTIPVTAYADTQPYLDLLNIRFTIAPDEHFYQDHPKLAGFNLGTPFYDQEVRMFLRPRALPRAFVVHRAIFEPDKQKLFEAIRKNRKDFDKVVALQHAPLADIQGQLRSAPLKDDSTAAITAYGPNEVALDVTMQNPGFLVLGDAYHPDWNVYVNGQPADIYPANYLLRAVFLPPGKHAVIFRFEPPLFYLGILISGCTSTLLLALLFSSILAERKNRLSSRHRPSNTSLPPFS